MYASGKKVDNLIATIDYNQKQIDGSIDEVLPMGNIKAKLEAFDWLVLEEFQGNNVDPKSDWLAVIDDITGEQYFWDRSTGQTKWDPKFKPREQLSNENKLSSN